MSVTKRMRILKAVAFADFTEKKAKRIYVLKNGRAGRLHIEKSQKMNVLKERGFECCCSTKRIEAIAVRCTFVMQSPREKNLQSVIVIANVVEYCIIHETCSLLSFICLSASGAEGFRCLESLPFSEEPKRIRK